MRKRGIQDAHSTRNRHHNSSPTHVQLLVVTLRILLSLGLGLQLVLQVLKLALDLLLHTLRHLSLLSLVLQLRLQLPDLLGQAASQLLRLLLFGCQLTLVVGLGSLQVDLVIGERGERGERGRGRGRGEREG